MAGQKMICKKKYFKTVVKSVNGKSQAEYISGQFQRMLEDPFEAAACEKKPVIGIKSIPGKQDRGQEKKSCYQRWKTGTRIKDHAV